MLFATLEDRKYFLSSSNSRKLPLQPDSKSRSTLAGNSFGRLS